MLKFWNCLNWIREKNIEKIVNGDESTLRQRQKRIKEWKEMLCVYWTDTIHDTYYKLTHIDYWWNDKNILDLKIYYVKHTYWNFEIVSSE